MVRGGEGSVGWRIRKAPMHIGRVPVVDEVWRVIWDAENDVVFEMLRFRSLKPAIAAEPVSPLPPTIPDLQHDLAWRPAALLGRERRAPLGERHHRTDYGS